MKNLKERAFQFLCKHEVAEDRGPVQLWNGDTKMLKQCSCCGALFVDGYDMYTELPNMWAKWNKSEGK